MLSNENVCHEMVCEPNDKIIDKLQEIFAIASKENDTLSIISSKIYGSPKLPETVREATCILDIIDNIKMELSENLKMSIEINERLQEDKL